MRVYVLAVLLCLCSLRCLAVDDNDQEVKVVGDKNYTNNAALVYDGIDISNYQKDINWDATAKDKHIKYVYIKATEGASHKQHRYRRNIEHARQRGIKVGSYHFMTTTAPIQKQFENFISVARREEQDLIPLLDVEKRNGWSIKQLQDSVMKFAKLLENYYGCKPMIYASSNYFNNYLGAQFKHYPLFIARYSKSEPQLSYGAKWILWQFSDCGRIEGIDALVDLSRFNKGCGVKDIAYHHKGSHQPSKPRRNNGDVPRPRPREKKEQPAVPPQQRGNAGTQPTRTEKSEAQKRGEENERRRQKQEEERRKKEEEKRRKEEEKRRKEEEKRRKEEEKKRQEQEKKRQEQEKKRQEQEKKRQEQERKRQEQEKQRQAAEMKQQAQERRHQEELARQRQLEEDKRLAEQQRQQQERDRQRSQAQAQERMRREKQRQQQELAQEQEKRDRQRKDELEQARQERIEKQRHQQQAAGNQSKPASGKQQQVASTQLPASRHQAPARPQAPRPRKPGGNQSSADNDEVHYNSQWRSHAKKKDNDDDD